MGKPLAALAALAVLFSCTKTKVVELNVNPMAVSLTAAAGDERVAISCNDAWTATKTADWITLSAASGTGNASLKITVTANESLSKREADVTVAAGELTRVVKVTQLGQEPAVAVSPATKEVAAAGEEVEVTVTSNTAWTVSVPEACDWVTANPASGTGNGSFKLVAAENRLLEGREVTVTVAAGADITATVVLSQAAGSPSRYTDSLALVAIYNASKGAEWTKGKWNLENEMSTWAGVKLDASGRVEELKFTTTVTIPEEWEIPAEIGNLSELIDLRINKQKVKGEIQAAIYSLPKLSILYLTGNKLTGILSPDVAKLTELTQLYLDSNDLMSGSIPKEIGQLKKLERFNISQSGIGGAIPEELGQCESLIQFMAFKSKLEGTLPDIWDMPKLQTVMLHTSPGLIGELPASLGKVKKVSTAGPSIQIYNCNITGNIPESFAQLDGGEKKVQVHIYGNKMSGVIPLAVQQHKDFASWKYTPQQEGYGLTLE